MIIFESGLFYFKKIFKSLYFLLKYRNKLYFYFSSNISFTSRFEGANKVGAHSFFCGTMGFGSYIASDCSIYAVIGRFTSIAPFVHSAIGRHPYKHPFVSTCPMFFSNLKQNGMTFSTKTSFQEVLKKPVIGNDCWICENVFIAGGITIGDGAVVYAGAVVVEDVPPYSIVAGVPAHVIGYRYDEETIQYLLKIKWWDKDINWIKNNYKLFSNIDKFKTIVFQ